MVCDLVPTVAEEEHAQGRYLLGTGGGPAHTGTFHAVGAEAFTGALGQPTAHLIALRQESGVVQVGGAVGEIGGGACGLGRVRCAVGMRVGQRGEPHSLAWVKDIVLEFRAGFPDVRFAIEDLAAEGDKVWVRWTLHGTHQGDFMGNPPTGKVIRVEDNFNILRVANGRLVEDDVLWQCGFLEIFEQIGGVPPR